MLVAGYETVAALIASTLLVLLDTPAAYRAVTQDPSLVPAAIDEIARMEGPVAFGVTRYTTTDITIAGTGIPAGQRVLLSLGAADRDPDRWSHPDEFDLARPAGHTLAFCHGPHYCLGAHVARLEARTALAACARRLPLLELAERADGIPRQGGIFQGPARLLVRNNMR
ncbi:cytochrome P450 [Streptomyces lunaelactis]|uniref:cytochrome P450 n=1 Tax=Streptomyces lunaelactis TaxID=1535768 RepID=UPI00131EFDA4|nr:cytochrome P450 [Streptomyces lunaelactis]NUK27806.1 cytochrome P450 [Streptomyces lunaelactis]NUK88346.1 cytochrome P450 [Streptomyces lunaelactis]